MGLVLLLFSFIMYYLIERYNNIDCYSNIILDILVQILHIITVSFILYSFLVLNIGLVLKILGILLSVNNLITALSYLIITIKYGDELDYNHNINTTNQTNDKENAENNKDNKTSNDEKKER